MDKELWKHYDERVEPGAARALAVMETSGLLSLASAALLTFAGSWLAVVALLWFVLSTVAEYEIEWLMYYVGKARGIPDSRHWDEAARHNPEYGGDGKGGWAKFGKGKVTKVVK